MGFKEIKAAGSRALAVGGLIGALGGLGGDPVARNSPAGLRETYGKFGKQVVLPSKEKDIARTLRRATREKGDRSKSSTSLTRKDIKNLAK
ncbi:hypothetical protein [Rhodococcus rhodochrous]|uniref:hypothetical protein n=1 Tax=Rhodococcus rhodochrous TaxID=1829 RepID=UPI0013520C79|nr:hypothetical protein [Rhodococcus rhodochrous]